MDNKSLIPEGENLRRAIVWLSENSKDKMDSIAIEEVSVRFDLTPLEEEFLLKTFYTRK